MPFRAPGAHTWKTRIRLSDGRTGIFSCGTTEEATARAVEAAVRTWKRRRRWDVLGAIMEKRVRLADAFDASETDRLDELMARLEDPDLSPLVDEWRTYLEARGTESGARYVHQVRQLIPAGERFPASLFSRRVLSHHLSSLRVSGSTKNRHRAALMQFGRWLVETEVLETNPVRDVRTAKENAPRMLWLEREQAKALVDAMPAPFRALAALMAGTGMEWQAVSRARRRDVNLDELTVFAHGGKNPWRQRVCRITEAWTVPIVREHVRALTANAMLFPVSEKAALKAQADAAHTLGLPRTTLHDWRHTYAVLSLKAGLSETVVARQLGHRDTTLLRRVYGRFIPALEDYEPRGSTHIPRSSDGEGDEGSGKPAIQA